MLDRKLQSWFYPEPTGDVGRDRNARTLQFTCLLFAFAIALVAVLDTIARERVELPILVMAVVALFAAAAMNRAGMSAWAARIAIVAVLLTAILLVLEARDGFRSHAMLVFPGLLLISMTLLDRKSYVTTAGIVLLAVAALGIAERHGLTGAIPGIRTPTSYDSIFYVDLTLAVFAMIGSRIASDAQRNVFDLRASVERLSVANLELTKAAEALRRSESQARAQAAELQAIMDAAPAVILVANDAECRHVGGNQTAYAMMRQKPGTNLSLAAPEGERPTNRRVMQNGIEIPLNEMPLHKAAFTGQPIRNYDLEVVFEDGTSIDLLGNVEPIPDEKGAPRGVVAVLSDITQRKQAEDNLREALRQLQLITDNMATGVTRCSRDLRYVWVSRSYAAWLGRTPEEIAGRSIIEVLGPEYYEVIRPRIEKVLSGERVEYEAPVNSPGIGTGWIHAVYVPTKDRNNKVDGWIAVVTDVTERHESEERLRASEARLIEAQHLAKVGSWERHIDDDTIHWSDEMLRILGLPDSAPSNLSAFLSCVHPKDREKILEVDAKVRSDIAPVEVEYRIIRPNGETRFVRSIIEAIRNDQGLPVRIAGATQDITEQVRAEETLRESEARLRNAERIAHVGNWHWDISVNHVTCSEETLRILGGPQDYTSGFEGFLQTITPPDRERVYQWGKDCLKEKRGNSMEFQIARSNGDLRTVSCTSEVLLNEDGLPVHMVGTCQDVTDSRRAEAASRQSRDEMAHLNRVAAMGELATSLAHELNQPLAAILLNSQAASRFLSGQPPNLARVGDCLNSIAFDGERAGEVIQRLRGLLKKGESRASLVYVNEVVSDALRLVENDALLRQVSVKFEPLPGLPPVLGDRIQLYQVVLNLIVNGLDASAEKPPGDRWVLVRTAEADGGGVELTVEDSGKGIAEGDLARVFEPFFSTKPEGLGMGLSISRSIVEAHGGRIWAEKSVGRGVIFHCMLPVAQQVAVASAK
jgi:PAS domain S-box-containing protein